MFFKFQVIKKRIFTKKVTTPIVINNDHDISSYRLSAFKKSDNSVIIKMYLRFNIYDYVHILDDLYNIDGVAAIREGGKYLLDVAVGQLFSHTTVIKAINDYMKAAIKEDVEDLLQIAIDKEDYEEAGRLTTILKNTVNENILR